MTYVNRLLAVGLWLIAAPLTTAACSGDSSGPSLPPEANLAPPPEGQGFQLSVDFIAPAAQETWRCFIYPLPTSQIENVSRVEYRQNPGTHHLTLSTLGLTPTDKIAPGEYDCNELYGDASLMEDQIMFFGTQGEGQGTMNLPDGIAASLPPQLTIMHEVHFVNSTAEDLAIYSRLNAWTIPNEEVDDGIWGGSVRDEHINIPPLSEHEEWSRCVMNEDVEVLFLASHMHEMGDEFTIAPFDGENVGEVMYTNDDWHIPLITQYEEPIVVPAGQGFEWKCKWNNTRAEAINYGLEATDEMCNLAVVFTPFSTTAACEVVETSDGVLWETPEL